MKCIVPSSALLFSALALAMTSCSAPGGTRGAMSPGEASASGAPRDAIRGTTYTPTITISHPPFDEMAVSWMQRLDQPYVYVTFIGPYSSTADHIPMLLHEMKSQGIEPSDAPFCLFYDDPGKVPANELYSRACIPIAEAKSPRSPLQYEVLPSRAVAYAIVSGHYDRAPQAYPHIFAYMKKGGWVMDGPIRETYIVPPSAASAPSDLVCEIQIPWTPGS